MSAMPFPPWSKVALLLTLAALLGELLLGCSSSLPRRSPVDETMPEVSLRTADGGSAELPALAGGEPAVVLVAYERQAQFDLDRWLVGLQQVQVPVELFQVAAGKGLRTSRDSGWLDEAIRSALPDQGWSFVRAEAAGEQALRRATGDAEGQNVRVLVLDGEGQVQLFSDVGYSASRARTVADMVDSLRREVQLPAEEQRPRARAATLAADDPAVRQAAEAGAAHPLVGRAFPVVEGKSLAGESIRLPEALAGAPAVVLVGFVQPAQVDIDQWILGLIEAGVTARLLELPTIPGSFVGLAGGFIDDGMRGGIPQEDWGAVLTLYGSRAEPVDDFLDDREGRAARVLLLDAEGKVRWYDSGGYAPEKARAVAEALRSGD